MLQLKEILQAAMIPRKDPVSVSLSQRRDFFWQKHASFANKKAKKRDVYNLFTILLAETLDKTAEKW